MNWGTQARILAATAVLIGGSTARAQIVKYEPMGLFGGYKDKEIEPGIWKVTASANAISGGVSLTDPMALYRAAELLKMKGFRYIRVLHAKTTDLGLFFPGQTYSTYQSDGGPGASWYTVRGALSFDDIEGCRMKSADECKTLEIDALMGSLRPLIRFKKAK